LLDIHYLGAQTRYEVQVGSERLTAITSSEQQGLQIGSAVTLRWDSSALRPLQEGA
jgi:putative spermidine/putrescine transport system ATP-binding protein